MTQRTKVDELRDALKKQSGAPESKDLSDHRDADATQSESGEAPAEANATALTDLQAQLKDAEERAATHHDKLVRMMAEFDNYRKRIERDKASAIAFANEQLLKEMMLVLDHLDEALARVPTGEECPAVMRPFAEGVELTFRQFLHVLKKYGLEEVPAEVGAPFDPSMHEAVGRADAEGMASNSIVLRQRRGYALHGRLLRAALVMVAK